MRHAMLRHLCLALAVIALLLQGVARTNAAENRPAAEKPNIVFIMADDLGWGHLGSYGQERIETPHLDRLAAQGIRFTQAYAGSHVCAPSRSVLMTGLHTGHTPIRQNGSGIYYNSDDVTLAMVLKDAGYATGGFGKWGGGIEGTAGHPNRKGFDEWFGQLHQVHAHFYYPYWVWHNDEKYLLPGNEGGKQQQYVQDELQAKALDFIRRNHDRPFFAYLPYLIPHVELAAPKEWEQRYHDKFPQIRLRDRRAGYLGSDHGLATYAGMISYLDHQVGEVLAVLDELGIADNTIVIFTSDNGAQSGGRDGAWSKLLDFFQGNGPLRGAKGDFYEGGIRVPLIARWPGKIEPGTVSDHQCAFWDVLPTLAEATGATLPDHLDGISFLATLVGNGEQEKHEYLYWGYPRGENLEQAVRMGDWKAIRPNARSDEWELYNLATDISESDNVAEQRPRLLARMQELAAASHTPARPFDRNAEHPSIDDYVR